MKYVVMVALWTQDYYDVYDFEFSGIRHDNKEDAEKELKEAFKKCCSDILFENAWIDEVEYE